jgi:hypothetical protein
LLQLQDLLRERVDLRVLLVDFLAEGLEHFVALIVPGKSLGRDIGAHEDSDDEDERGNEEAVHGLELWHLRPAEASAGGGGQLAFPAFIPNVFSMPERTQKPPMPWGPKQGDGEGPKSPDVSRPDTRDLLKKMRKVDPNQSKRYRQRTGQ